MNDKPIINEALLLLLLLFSRYDFLNAITFCVIYLLTHTVKTFYGNISRLVN